MIKRKQDLAEKQIQNFVKTLLKETDKQLQLMYGRNIKLFDKPDMRQLLVSHLKDKNTRPDQLRISPKVLKDFNRGINFGIATAHYHHTTKGDISPQQFAVDFIQHLFFLSGYSQLKDPKFASYSRYFFNTILSNLDKGKNDRINSFLKTIKEKELYALGQQMTNLNASIRKLYK